MTIGEKLRALREAAGLSQSDLAAASGVSLDSVQNYEQSRCLPSVVVAAKLVRAMGQRMPPLDDCDEVAPAGKRGRGRPKKGRAT